MSYLLAGAAAGFGDELTRIAAEKRKAAQDLLMAKEKQAIADESYQNRLDMKAAAKGRGGSGGGRRGGGSSGGRGFDSAGKIRPLDARERDDFARSYKGMVENGFFEGKPPTESQLAAEVERIRGANPNLSLSAATQAAAESWGSEEVSETVQKDRHPLSPMRLLDDDGKYEETNTELRYGFKSAMNAEPSQPAASGGGKEATALQEARAAIQRGAPVAAVQERLRQMGIDPGKL